MDKIEQIEDEIYKIYLLYFIYLLYPPLLKILYNYLAERKKLCNFAVQSGNNIFIT